MKHILFVDDEPRILEGLRNRLRRQRKKWDMTFVESGRKALEVMEAGPVDVIVTDMRMPEMDGATLLARVQAEHSGVARIVLSGHAELESALRAVPVAHQFLTKPCDPGVLENVVERACNLQLLLGDEVVRTVVGGIDKLPPLPRVYTRLTALLSSDEASADDVSQLLRQDMAICAKLLQVVNSAFFRLARTITRVEEAVSYLGFNSIKQIALAAEVFNSNGSGKAPISLDELQNHAIHVGNLTSSMFEDKKRKEDAFVVGLLHDIGKLLLAVELPEHMGKVLEEMKAAGCDMHTAEMALFGVSHAEIGGYLLGLWGLPYPIVEAVANHHDPDRVATTEFDMLAATYIADSLAHDVAETGGEDGAAGDGGIGRVYLEKFGVEERLDDWRELARETLPSAVAAGD